MPVGNSAESGPAEGAGERSGIRKAQDGVLQVVVGLPARSGETGETGYGERIAPGSLTFALAEGLTTQTGMIHGTGLAFVGLQGMRLYRPVKVGDTIGVEIEVIGRGRSA